MKANVWINSSIIPLFWYPVNDFWKTNTLIRDEMCPDQRFNWYLYLFMRILVIAHWSPVSAVYTSGIVSSYVVTERIERPQYSVVMITLPFPLWYVSSQSRPDFTDHNIDEIEGEDKRDHNGEQKYYKIAYSDHQESDSFRIATIEICKPVKYKKKHGRKFE